MIRLPWVLRSTMIEAVDNEQRVTDALNVACVAATSERDWLRAQLETALDHNRRLERVAAKVHEVPVSPKKPREPMPKEVREMIDAWQAESTRSQLESEAWRRYERDGNWDGVIESLAATAAD